MRKFRTSISALGVFALMTAAVSAAPFTFQGQLKDAGVPVTGRMDMQFSLVDDASRGNVLAGPIEHLGVGVKNGLFTVQLDFPGFTFDGNTVFVEVGVRDEGGSTYETLHPAQPITAAPFAMYAMDAPGGGGGGTLDDAYDFGGPGAGNLITADNGPVHISGTDGLQVDAGIMAGPVAIRSSTADFDVQVRKAFSFNGTQPEPATVGMKITKGTLLNPIQEWLYMRMSTVGAAIRRSIGTSLAFDVEGSVNNLGIWITQMFLDSSGNLGIGTVTPLAKLHIDGGTDTELGQGGYVIIGANGSRNISIDNNEIMSRNAGYISPLYLNNSGGDVIVSGSGASNLGVGTANPKGRLHVNGDYYGLGHMWLHAYEGDGNSGTAYIQARDDSQTSSIALRFRTKTGPTIRDVMTLNPIGHVGIGTTSPAQLLHVAGTARVEVLQISGGADLSEGFDVEGDGVRPGMVVSIDPEHPGQLVPCSHAYDQKVAGIVSGAGGITTGMIMGQEGTLASGRHPIALSGRVYCLVDASSSAVEPGDLLTSSTVRGHAMKVTDRQRANGAILGKAMTALGHGEKGLVLVLVSLQ